MIYQKPQIIMFILLMIGVVLYQNLSYPDIDLIDHPAKEFSPLNAFNNLKVIAQQPRRMYQPYYNETHNYIIDELKKLGIKPETQQSTSLDPRNPIFYSSVDNIIAKIEGSSDKGDAILLVAHLDSEPFVSPGAGDDGAAVAIMLEIARAVKSSRELQNDIVLLFSSPEESGLQGVTAFINEHPFAKDVKIVFNFDGLGNGKFGARNTSVNNNWLMQEYTKACPSSQAYSLVSFVIPYPPTDGTAFIYAGFSEIDFMSYYFSSRAYHSKNDNLSIISLSSLQEAGNNILSMVNHFGNINIDKKNREQSVYYSVLGLFIMNYPQSYVLPFSILVFLISAVLIFYSSKKEVINLKKLLIAVFLFILGFIVATGLVKLIWYLITEFHPMFQFMFNDAAYNTLYFFLSFIILSFMCVYGVYLIGHRKINFNSNDSEYSVLALLTIVNLLLSFFFPDLASMLTLVILFLQIFIITRLISKELALLKMIIKIVYLSVAIILITPIIMISFMSTDNDIMRYMSMLILSIILLPVLYEMVFEFRKIVFPVLGLAFIVLLIIPLTDNFSEANPRVTYVSCMYDADRNNAFWLTNNLYKSDFDDYSKQFVKEGSKPESVRKFIPDYLYDYEEYFTPISIDSLQAPKLEVVKDSTFNEFRFLDLKIKSLRDAWEITVFKDPKLNVIEYALDGIKCEPHFDINFENSDKNLLCFYRNPRKDGIMLSLKVRAGEKIMLKIRDRTYGIPLRPGMKPMNNAMIPWIDRGANTTTVIKTFNL